MVYILQRSRHFLRPDGSIAPLLFLAGKREVGLAVPKLPGLAISLIFQFTSNQIAMVSVSCFNSTLQSPATFLYGWTAKAGAVKNNENRVTPNNCFFILILKYYK